MKALSSDRTTLEPDLAGILFQLKTCEARKNSEIKFCCDFCLRQKSEYLFLKSRNLAHYTQ